jgi:hypothetical protein
LDDKNDAKTDAGLSGAEHNINSVSKSRVGISGRKDGKSIHTPQLLRYFGGAKVLDFANAGSNYGREGK